MIPNYLTQFKTREEALAHILQMFVENPGVADAEGFCNITMGKTVYRMKPVKKKQKEE